VEGANEVLALLRVDPGLPTDGGVDHGEQRRRDLDDSNAAQPGGGDEAGEVGGRPSPDPDDDVGAGEVRLPEDLPAERGDLGGLRLLRIGYFGDERFVALL